MESFVSAVKEIVVVADLLFGVINTGIKLFGSDDNSQDFKHAQQRHAREMEQQKRHSEETKIHLDSIIQSALEILKESTQRLANLPESQERRRMKVQFVNDLKLQIRHTESVLLIGPKGSGKSTFLWLLGEGPKPTQTFGDGTLWNTRTKNFVDTVGLSSWAIEEFIKLVVLLIYEGFPKDLVVFSDERIELPIATLLSANVKNPMVAVLSSNLWKNAVRSSRFMESNRKSGSPQIMQTSDITELYENEVHKAVRSLGMGTPVTHHDIHQVIARRRECGISPFKSLLACVPKGTYTVATEPGDTKVTELMFRFTYVYEKSYKDKPLAFLNRATLYDFERF